MANNFNPYNNGYNNNFYMQEFQNMKDRIDKTMQQYQQNQYVPQQQVQPQIQQTFQLAPNQNNSNTMDALIVNSEEEVRNQLVVKPTIFTTQDYSSIWIKDVTGNVRYFRTEEIIQVDENIQEINNLKQELAEVKALLIQQTKMQNKQDEITLEEKKSSKK